MNMYAARAHFQNNAPHTFNAMQSLVMSMEETYRARGKKTFFGYDKELKAYTKFLSELRNTIRSLVLDGLLEESDEDIQALDCIRIAIEGFKNAFPNWPDAYQFAREFFGDGNKKNAITVIGRLR